YSDPLGLAPLTVQDTNEIVDFHDSATMDRNCIIPSDFDYAWWGLGRGSLSGYHDGRVNILMAQSIKGVVDAWTDGRGTDYSNTHVSVFRPDVSSDKYNVFRAPLTADQIRLLGGLFNVATDNSIAGPDTPQMLMTLQPEATEREMFEELQRALGGLVTRQDVWAIIESLPGTIVYTG